MAVQARVITQSGLLRWARSEDWLTLLLVTTSMVVVARSVEAAQWAVTPSLSLAAVLGAFTGLAVARIPWKWWQGHLLALGVGAMATYLQVAGLTEATTVAARMSELNSRLADWWTALVRNDISTDTLPFAFILSFLSWLGGYLASRTVFKGGNVWLAVVPSALGLLINLTYLPERYYFYMFPFLLATMMLIVRIHSVQQVIHLERQGIGHPPSLRMMWLVAGLILSSLIVGGVFLLPPSHARQKTLANIWSSSRQPAEWFQGQFGRLFSAVGTKGVILAKRFGATLPILPMRSTGTETVFSGYISYPAYWKVRAYNTYTPGGWSSDDTTLEPAPTLLSGVGDSEEDDMGSIAYQVKVASPTPYIYVPSPYVIWLSVPAQIEHSKDAFSLSDVITLRPKKRLETGDSYTGGFQSPFYSMSVLRSTGQDYPQWATGRYLELPSSLPERVRDLAIQSTQDATNQYDKAVAVEKYLRTNYEYGNATSVPGFNEDRVDHFLFQSKTGHSDHFASAMTVLLRAAGIPARLIAGYGPGERDEEGTAFTVTEDDQHSWTEAYIPSVGWIEFEPSPIYPLRPRQASSLLDFTAGLVGANSTDSLPDESPYRETVAEEEIDAGGGRLPGGRGMRPFPLILHVSPMSMNGLLLIGIMAVWVAGLGWVWCRSFLGLPRPELAYTRMYRMATLLAIETKTSHTAMEFGGALAAALPEAREDIYFICGAYCKARYGDARLSEQEKHRLGLAWTHVRKAIVRYSMS